MVKAIMLVSLLTSVGCFSNAALETQRKTEIDRVANEGFAQLVVPACTKDNAPQLPGMTTQYLDNGKAVRVSCGLIIAKLLAPEDMQRFNTEVCHGVTDAQCTNTFFQM